MLRICSCTSITTCSNNSCTFTKACAAGGCKDCSALCIKACCKYYCDVTSKYNTDWREYQPDSSSQSSRVDESNIPLHQLSDTCSKYWLGPQDFCRHAYLAYSQLYWQNLSSMIAITAVTHKLLWYRALFMWSVSMLIPSLSLYCYKVHAVFTAVALFGTVCPCPWWQHVQCCCICHLRLSQSTTTTIESSAFELIIPVGCKYLAGLNCIRLLTLMLRYSARCATKYSQTIWTYRLQSEYR